MDANEFLLKIYSQIDVIVRKATKEAVEEALKNKFSKESTEEDEFLSAEQTAQFLKIKLSSLYSKVEKFDFPHYRSGKRKLLFKKTEIEAYVSARRCKSRKEIAEEVDKYVLTKRISNKI